MSIRQYPLYQNSKLLTDTTATFIHSVPKSTDITAKEYTDGMHIAKMAIIAHNGDLDRGIISVKKSKNLLTFQFSSSFQFLSFIDIKFIFGKTRRKLRFRLTPRDKSIKPTLFLKAFESRFTFGSRLDHV